MALQLQPVSSSFSLSSANSRLPLAGVRSLRSISAGKCVLRPPARSCDVLSSRRLVKTTTFCVRVEEGEKKVLEAERENWGKVSAVLFDMDGVLCNSEEPSRRAAVDVFAEMGVDVTAEDFVPFMGTGKDFNSILSLSKLVC